MTWIGTEGNTDTSASKKSPREEEKTHQGNNTTNQDKKNK